MPTRLSIDVTAGVMHANVGLRSDLSTITKTRHERSQKRNQSAGQSTHELQVWKKEANMPTSQHQPSPSGGYRMSYEIDRHRVAAMLLGLNGFLIYHIAGDPRNDLFH